MNTNAENIYRGWDCHSYSNMCLDFWNEIKIDGLNKEKSGDISNSAYHHLISRMEPEDCEKLFANIKNVYSNIEASSIGWQALDKMRSRYNLERGGYEDSVLVGLNISRLLQLVWEIVITSNEPSIIKMFWEIVSDIGLTCNEGDSHRLLMFMAGLAEDSANIQTTPD